MLASAIVTLWCLTTPSSLRDATPPREGNSSTCMNQNSPPVEGWQAKPDGVVF